jgi:hypothetical protein
MQYRPANVLVACLVVTLGAAAQVGRLDGNYVAEEVPTVRLTLEERANGEIAGVLEDGQSRMPVTARRSSTGFGGQAGPPGDELPISAIVDGARVLLTLGDANVGMQLTFRPVGAAPAAAADAGPRRVIINGKPLGADELAAIERQYGVRLASADFWYDRTLGAWGLRGGPTLGFTAAGLNLGGELQADASGGNTLVFVNGRALHPIDLMLLQNLTGPILPGRYFIRADGFAGYEGGPAQWNLLAMAQQAGGGSNTWQSRLTGASGFSDGTTGAVFLPNGGIVSTGQ